MPNDMVDVEDPIMARNFTLELQDGAKIPLLAISGFDTSVEVTPVTQNLPGGQQMHYKTRAGATYSAEVTVTRLAPKKEATDPIWTWWEAIRTAGPTGARQAFSIVLYDASPAEVARYNFINGWPSKIQTSDMETGSQDPVKEQITFVSDRMERVG